MKTILLFVIKSLDTCIYILCFSLKTCIQNICDCLIILNLLLVCGFDIFDSLKLKFYLNVICHLYLLSLTILIYIILSIIVRSQELGFELFGCSFWISWIQPTEIKCFLPSKVKFYCRWINRKTLFSQLIVLWAYKEQRERSEVRKSMISDLFFF